MLKWFDSQEVDKFADWLAAEIVKRYPPTGLDTDSKKAAQRLRKVHDSLFLRVEAFAREHSSTSTSGLDSVTASSGRCATPDIHCPSPNPSRMKW